MEMSLGLHVAVEYQSFTSQLQMSLHGIHMHTCLVINNNCRDDQLAA